MEMYWRCPLTSRGKAEPVDEGTALCGSKEWLVVLTGDFLQFGGSARAQYSECSVYLLDGRRMLETKCYESFTWLWKKHSPAAAAAAADLTGYPGNARLGSLPGRGPYTLLFQLGFLPPSYLLCRWTCCLGFSSSLSLFTSWNSAPSFTLPIYPVNLIFSL